MDSPSSPGVAVTGGEEKTKGKGGQCSTKFHCRTWRPGSCPGPCLWLGVR